MDKPLQAEAELPAKRQRIEIIDALRGLAVTLMVCHHILFDVYAFFGAPRLIYMNPVFAALQDVFVGVFVIVSGISSRFSRRNVERGAIVLLIGVVISYITIRIIGMPILFGILSVLGTLMIFYGLTHKLWDKITGWGGVILYVALVIIGMLARTYLSPTSDVPVLHDLLSILGWRQPGHNTNDYHPLIPWLFVFLLGTLLGGYIKDGKFPKWFYDAKFPFFPTVGRNALIIYVLHQPILYGITQLVLYLQQ